MPSTFFRLRSLVMALHAAVIGSALLVAPAASANDAVPALKAPRFASLKVDRVDVYREPDRAAASGWVFNRVGMPVEVLQVSGAWSQVRDVEGVGGWVASHLLSARRTAIVAARGIGPVLLRTDRRDSGGALAELEPGLIAGVVGCDGSWCELVVNDLRGFVEQTRLWGVYADERFD